MVKPKRKSEGDLPPPRKRARQVSASDAEDEGTSSNNLSEQASSDGLFMRPGPSVPKTKQGSKTVPTKVKAKGRHSEPVKRLAWDDEGDEQDDGAGAMESQQFLNLISAQQEKKSQLARSTATFVTNFREVVERDEKTLKQQLETLREESNHRDQDFSSNFLAALESSRPRSIPREEQAHPPHAARRQANGLSFATLQSRSHDMIAEARDMLQTFEAAAETTKSIHVSDFVDVDAWKDNVDRVEDVLAAGKRVGLRTFENMLNGTSGGGGSSSKRNSPDNKIGDDHDDEDEMELGEQFYLDRRDGDGGGYEYRSWGGVARKVERATRKMVKVLPAVVSLD